MIFNKKNYERPKYSKLLFVLLRTSFGWFRKDKKKKISMHFFNQGQFLDNLVSPGLPKLKADAIKPENCDACHLCVDVCPTECLTMVNGGSENRKLLSLKLNTLDCVSCGLCADLCPDKVFYMSNEVAKAGHFEKNWVEELFPVRSDQ